MSSIGQPPLATGARPATIRTYELSTPTDYRKNKQTHSYHVGEPKSIHIEHNHHALIVLGQLRFRTNRMIQQSSLELFGIKLSDVMIPWTNEYHCADWLASATHISKGPFARFRQQFMLSSLKKKNHACDTTCIWPPTNDRMKGIRSDDPSKKKRIS